MFKNINYQDGTRSYKRSLFLLIFHSISTKQKKGKGYYWQERSFRIILCPMTSENTHEVNCENVGLTVNQDYSLRKTFLYSWRMIDEWFMKKILILIYFSNINEHWRTVSVSCNHDRRVKIITALVCLQTLWSAQHTYKQVDYGFFEK